MGVLKILKRDIQAALERDPAARNALEVILCYPGFHVLFFHRVAHWLWEHRRYLSARFISQLGRFFTGIEIHPGAKIGPGFFIDHGMGVVIGETAEIGENVTLYHGVTLGGKSLERVKRHPTLGDNVVIGAHAQIIGPVRIGDNSRVGAGSVVVSEVPANCVVVGVPGKIVYKDGKRVERFDLRHDELPDPVAEALQCMLERVQDLEKEVERLKKQNRKGEDDGASMS
jgi:serine O-acetyltransferase